MGDKLQQAAGAAKKLAAHLLAARQTRNALDLAATPELRPASLDEAYATQAVHLDGFLASAGGRQTGYKLGATSHATMQALGFAEPFHGPVVDSWTHTSPAVLKRSDFFVCAIELEVGVRLSADLDDPALDMAQLRDAIAEVFPVMEIADTRYRPGTPPGPTAIVADLGNAAALVVGEPCQNWRELDLDQLPARLSDGGATVAEGGAALVVDGPLGQLLRFARNRFAAGKPLRAGEIVSTGSCIPPYPAQAGQRLIGDLGGLGQVALTLS